MLYSARDDMLSLGKEIREKATNLVIGIHTMGSSLVKEGGSVHVLIVCVKGQMNIIGVESWCHEIKKVSTVANVVVHLVITPIISVGHVKFNA